MNSIPIFSTWIVGAINGIKGSKDEKEKLSNNIKYGTMGLSTALMWAKVFYNSTPTPTARNILSPALGATIAAPLIIGTTFCLGTYSGRAIRELDNHPMR